MKMDGNEATQDIILKINRLKEICSKVESEIPLIDFPQIIVIGSQSSGKSSVLENFVGRDFLPRGSGTVTRCPLILTLVYHDSNEEYGTFDHYKNKIFDDFDEIKQEIINRTEELTGGDLGITKEPIRLSIFSANVINLTLVDLPGVIRLAHRNQPKDIEKKIRKMIKGFISNKNTIILAVSAANQDLNTSDGLMLAKEVDPEGSRTIGVLTKVDLMDDGTNVRKELLGQGEFPLELGYVAVLNRSQKNIDDNVDIISARNNEREFFANSKIYRDLAERSGSEYLQKILNKLLSERLYEKIPEMKRDLQQQKFDLELEQKRFSLDMKESLNLNELSIDDRRIYLTEKRTIYLNGIYDEFSRQIGRSDSGKVNTRKISYGAQINEILSKDHSDKIDHIKLDSKDILKQLEISTQNVRGAYGGLLVPDAAFESVMDGLISDLAKPSSECLSKVSAILFRVLDECAEKFCKYPKLVESTKIILKNFVGEMVLKTQEHIDYVVKFQKSFINFEHEDFKLMNGLNYTKDAQTDASEISTMVADVASQALPITGKMAVNLIVKPAINAITSKSNNNKLDEETFKFNVIDKYVHILKKTFKDFIPKVIISSLIEETRNFLRAGLSSELDRKFQLNDLMVKSRAEEEKIKLFKVKRDTILEALEEIEKL